MSKGYSKNSWGSSQGKVHIPNPNLIGMGGTQSNQLRQGGFDLLKEYISLELPEDKLEGLEEHFNSWINDDSYLKEYDRFNLTREDKVIVRLYRYEAPISEMLVDPVTGGPMMGYKILPYAKVIKAHDKGKLSEGDIVCTSEDVAVIKTSPAWIEWKVKRANDDISDDVPEPDKLSGLLARWKENIIRRNPFKIDADDSFTFLVSDMEFKAIYKKA